MRAATPYRSIDDVEEQRDNDDEKNDIFDASSSSSFGTAGKKLTRGSDDLASQTRDSDVAIESWGHLRELWRARLEALAEEFLSGDVSITPSTDACRYCSYAGLCRFEDDVAHVDEESAS